MTDHKAPIQSLIDHIKTAVDVDPWAKEMAEELLKKQKSVKPDYTPATGEWSCGNCGSTFDRCKFKYCPNCGRRVKWDDSAID